MHPNAHLDVHPHPHAHACMRVARLGGNLLPPPARLWPKLGERLLQLRVLSIAPRVRPGGGCCSARGCSALGRRNGRRALLACGCRHSRRLGLGRRRGSLGLLCRLCRRRGAPLSASLGLHHHLLIVVLVVLVALFLVLVLVPLAWPGPCGRKNARLLPHPRGARQHDDQQHRHEHERPLVPVSPRELSDALAAACQVQPVRLIDAVVPVGAHGEAAIAVALPRRRPARQRG
mmetsp:Transcript_63291/g.188466  ORF Transcript_63291/g.188466 Transcript_63291/m.188466 type:complete len:232 (+) Transcript_63291:644-1339(+)